MQGYGKELILDLHGCNLDVYDVEYIQDFFDALCEIIDMEQVEAHFWEDRESKELHLRGVSAIQFIKTSNVTIHAIELMQQVYINVFSCADFETSDVEEVCLDYFGGFIAQSKTIERL